MKIYTRFTLLLFSLFCWVSSYAAEQDNWYIAWEVSVPSCEGVAYHVDQTSGVGQIYVVGSNQLRVFDLNGSLARSFAGFNDQYDLVINSEGTIFSSGYTNLMCFENDGTLKWQSGQYGSDDGQVREAFGITIGEDANLYVADYGNFRIQVFDKNGTFIRKFGERGSAPGQVFNVFDIVSLPQGRVLVTDGNYGHYFDVDGTFIKRESSMSRYVALAPDGCFFSDRTLIDNAGKSLLSLNEFNRDSRTCFTPEGDLVESYNSKLRLWKRAFRTKGLPERNIIAQPAIRGVSQRAGTNIIDIDVEIIDADDSNVTLGVLAAIDGEFDNPNKWIIPQAWVDYSEEKIGTPISTNQEHRLSWDVKQDWAEQTGSLQFEVFAQTGSRTKPIDVHYLTLPLNDGNLTISRSPIKDPEMVNYFKYLLTTGQSGIALQGENIVDGNGVVLVERLSNTLQVTMDGRERFINALGHRWAKLVEVSRAREAATPGTINQWSANRQVKPRNLPGQVNEYGFDVGSDHGSRAWWVVKNSTLPVHDFNTTVFDNNGSEDENFGRVVAVDGNLVAVGVSNQSDNIYKKVYIYEISENNGSLDLKFIVQPDNLNSNDTTNFGSSLALRNGFLLVGAYGAYVNNVWAVGASYLFDVNGSSPQQLARITASDGSSGDYFGGNSGRGVAISDNLLVIGAHGDDPNGNQDAGSAYIFRRESNGDITEITKLIAPDGRSNDYFGSAVAVDGNFIAVGASSADVERDGSLQGDAGKVYLYKMVDGNASYVETLTFEYPHSSAYFGGSLGISDGMLAVGSFRNEYNTDGSFSGHTDSGSVSLYKLTENSPARSTAFLKSPVPVQSGYFGWSVDMQGNQLLVGAYQEDSERAADSGAAYLFEISEDGKPTLIERFTHPQAKASDRFGTSVGVSGRNLIIGANYFDLPNERWNAGQAIFYRASE